MNFFSNDYIINCENFKKITIFKKSIDIYTAFFCFFETYDFKMSDQLNFYKKYDKIL